MAVRVLFVTPDRPCGHDYLFDHLFNGFKELVEEAMGGEVATSSVAPWLHLPEHARYFGSWSPALKARDSCNIDSDQACPRAELTGPPDIVLGSIHALDELRRFVGGVRGGCPVAVVDGTDTPENHHDKAASATAGRLARYFKRELPLGQGWATPLPFTYPRRRAWCVPPWNERKAAAVYYTTDHGGAAQARRQIATELERMEVSAANRVLVTPAQDKRPPPERVHYDLGYSLVGVHWNIFSSTRAGDAVRGWDANRFWENCAFGVVTVGLRPFIEVPHPFTHGENVVWVDDASHVAPAVADLLAEPDHARAMARAAHEHFVRYHCAVARARYILQHCGFTLRRGEL